MQEGEQSGCGGWEQKGVSGRAGMAHFTIHWQGKLQKHQAFEAEVANSGAIVKLDETGNLDDLRRALLASETIRVSWGPAGMMACLSLAGGWVGYRLPVCLGFLRR